MNRTDRLVALVMLLQSRRVITAAEMAAHFEITERTVYRDLAALGEGGVPIIGEPGVGYSLMRGYQLPPVMFSSQEAFSLVTAGLLAERMTDDSVRQPMRTALGKLTAVLPVDLQSKVHHLSKSMHIGTLRPGSGPVSLSSVQTAMADRHVLQIHYHGALRGQPTHRTIEPLGLVFYLDHWHLIAWCRLREEVRDFRVDRIVGCEILLEKSPPRPEFNLESYTAQCWQQKTYETAELELDHQIVEGIKRHWGPYLHIDAETERGIIATVQYDNAEYLAHALLSHGNKVRIISPKSLRTAVVKLAQQALTHHGQATKKSPTEIHS